MYISKRMDLRYNLDIPVLLIVIVIFTSPSLACKAFGLCCNSLIQNLVSTQKLNSSIETQTFKSF